jgi:hypothetical protein
LGLYSAVEKKDMFGQAFSIKHFHFTKGIIFYSCMLAEVNELTQISNLTFISL